MALSKGVILMHWPAFPPITVNVAKVCAHYSDCPNNEKCCRTKCALECTPLYEVCYIDAPHTQFLNYFIISPWQVPEFGP